MKFSVGRQAFAIIALCSVGVSAAGQGITSSPASARLLANYAVAATLDAPDSPSQQSGSIEQQEEHPSLWKRAIDDQASIYAAPFHRSSLKWDALFLVGTGALIATDRDAIRNLTSDHVRFSRNTSDVGLIGTGVAAGGIWLEGLSTHNPHAQETGYLTLETLANTAVVYAGTQLLTGRERPFEGTGNGRFWRNNALNSSFPSGHATFTWAMASVIAHEYPHHWVQWLVYGTATAVTVTRFTGREHFPSDVVVGSVFGYAIGTHIFHSRCKTGLSSACVARK
ncbi:MAG: phosphatase PAP2 family protein [Acidobacteriales bacterium]|nr:phosphatase PAP2 family protein [Terriglobales bacterium]